MIIKSKEIICPKCNENILIKIDEYKINLYNCKSNHEINNILLKVDLLYVLNVKKISELK